MDQTPNLKLPYLAAAQAQKHVTHNEAIRALDALVQIAVESTGLSSPPAAPAEGSRYIVGPEPLEAWAGHAGRLAARQDGAWTILIPREGWLAWDRNAKILLAFDGASWIAANDVGLNPVPLVGVNATADPTNRLAVSAPATLLNHAGAGHQLKLNKSAPPDTGSILWQTAYSGRAEIGLTGDDRLHVKVSPDGITWKESMVVDADARTAFGGPVSLAGYPKNALPSAATSGLGATIFVLDEAGGPTPAFSDGTSWRRVTDRAIVS